MQYITHLSTSLVVVLHLIDATDTLTVGTVLAVSKHFAFCCPSQSAHF